MPIRHAAGVLALAGSLLLSTGAAQARASHHGHHARSHSRHAGGGGSTFCTFYSDGQGRTASNLVPRGSWVLLSRGGQAMRVHVTDRGVNHFDLTPGQFRRFAPLDRGVVSGVHYRVLSRGR